MAFMVMRNDGCMVRCLAIYISTSLVLTVCTTVSPAVAWHSGRTLVFDRRLSLSCAQPTADGWPLMWVNCLLYRSANEADSAFYPFGVDKW